MSSEPNFSVFQAEDLQGNTVPMKTYEGQVVLVVNTASKGQGKQLLKKMQKIYDMYKERGFQILAFPCRQFLRQESKENQKIKERYFNKLHISFPVFSRVKVNGKEAHPLFKWLKHKKRGPFGALVDWNFTKFLVFSDGVTVKRFESSTGWHKVKKSIEKALQAKEANMTHEGIASMAAADEQAQEEEEEVSEIEEGDIAVDAKVEEGQGKDTQVKAKEVIAG